MTCLRPQSFVGFPEFIVIFFTILFLCRLLDLNLGKLFTPLWYKMKISSIREKNGSSHRNPVYLTKPKRQMCQDQTEQLNGGQKMRSTEVEEDCVLQDLAGQRKNESVP